MWRISKWPWCLCSSAWVIYFIVHLHCWFFGLPFSSLRDSMACMFLSVDNPNWLPPSPNIASWKTWSLGFGKQVIRFGPVQLWFVFMENWGFVYILTCCIYIQLPHCNKLVFLILGFSSQNGEVIFVLFCTPKLPFCGFVVYMYSTCKYLYT